MLILVFEV